MADNELVENGLWLVAHHVPPSSSEVRNVLSYIQLHYLIHNDVQTAARW